jgi:AraC-like DNA-binding protein
MIRDVQRQHDPDAEDDGAAFRVDHVPAIPETALRTFRLRHRVQSGRATALEIEEEMLGILAEVVKQCARERRLRPRRVEREPHRRRRDYAEAVKQHLAAAPERDATLEAIARHIGCSPFHLSHVFREETGLPIHQYSMRLRVAVGLDRLGEPTSLSTIGLDVGMTSHSHFSSVFRRVFGTTPSRVRQSAGISIRRRARAR